MVRTPLLALLAVGLACPGHAQIVSNGNRYTLRSGYKRGQTLRYVSTTTIRSIQQRGKGLVKISRSVVLSVLKVSKGTASVNLQLGAARMGGTVFAGGRMGHVTLTAFNQQTGGNDAGLYAVRYPVKPVRLGDTWQVQSAISLGPSNGAVLSMTYRLQGLENVGGRKVASISVNLKGIASGDGSILVDAKNGFLLSSTLHVILNTRTQGGVPVDLVVQKV